METTVTGPGSLSFWWKVSSESGFDYLEFYINGVLQAGHISGDVDWQQKSFDFGAGVQTLRWRYSKDGSTSSGQDRGWVDMVTFQFPSGPATILTQPQSQTVDEGTNVTFSVIASGEYPLTYQWFKGAGSFEWSHKQYLQHLQRSIDRHRDLLGGREQRSRE